MKSIEQAAFTGLSTGLANSGERPLERQQEQHLHPHWGVFEPGNRSKPSTNHSAKIDSPRTDNSKKSGANDLQHLDFASRLSTYILANRLLAFELTHVDDKTDKRPTFLKAGRSDLPIGIIPSDDIVLAPPAALSSPATPTRYFEKDTVASVARESISDLCSVGSPEFSARAGHLKNTLDSLVRDTKIRQAIGILSVESWRAANARGVKESEIAQVLGSVDDIITADKSPVKQKDRERLALQVLCHTAFPEHIDQGNHNTCALATMEEQLFYFKPEEAAQIACSAVRDESWTAPDGIKIQLDRGSLKPAREEFGVLPDDGKRSYASQLIQMTLVNESVQRRPIPEIYTQKHDDLRDTGEQRRYIDKKKQSTKLPYADTPDMSDEDLALQHYRLFQNSDKYLIVNKNANDKNQQPPDAIIVGNQHDLETVLAARKTANGFPLVVKVNAGNPPFSQPGFGDSWHAVSISDYDSKTKMAYICNQWGSDSDVAVPLSELYEATCSSEALLFGPSLILRPKAP